MEKNKETKEFNIQELLYAVLNKIWLIILAAVIGGVGMYFYTTKTITPMYRTSVTMYVNNSTKFLVDGEQQIDHIASSDLSTSERLVATYITILESNTVLNEVSDAVYASTGKRVSAGEISGSMSAGSINETEVFRVSISHADPVMAQAIANAIAEVLPDKISAVVDGSSVRVVDYAVEDPNPVGPVYRSFLLLGALIGFALGVVIVVIMDVTDTTITNEEYLTHAYENVPLLAIIPGVEMSKNISARGYYKGYYSSVSKDAVKKNGGAK